MLDMPLHVWAIGIGPGAFEDVFRIVTPSYFSIRFVYAHNDYLEFFFEFGLLLGLVIVFSFMIWLKNVKSRIRYHYLLSGVYGAISAVALHSVVDFNLQVPASALFVWMAVGLLANLSLIHI